MVEHDEVAAERVRYPVSIGVQPALEGRNRLTTAFRFFLALPHVILVGGPVAVFSSMSWGSDGGGELGFGSGGLLSVVAFFAAVLAWFAIVFTGRHPGGLWRLGSFYMRWRANAVAYLTLLRDEYPPFGEGAYPVELDLAAPPAPRDRLTVAFRFILVLPHVVILWLLSMAWAFTTAVAWAVILFTGRYPETLYGFAIGVLAWSVRVESYTLLLCDEYPPFTLRA